MNTYRYRTFKVPQGTDVLQVTRNLEAGERIVSVYPTGVDLFFTPILEALVETATDPAIPAPPESDPLSVTGTRG